MDTRCRILGSIPRRCTFLRTSHLFRGLGCVLGLRLRGDSRLLSSCLRFCSIEMSRVAPAAVWRPLSCAIGEQSCPLAGRVTCLAPSFHVLEIGGTDEMQGSRAEVHREEHRKQREKVRSRHLKERGCSERLWRTSGWRGDSGLVSNRGTRHG